MKKLRKAGSLLVVLAMLLNSFAIFAAEAAVDAAATAEPAVETAEPIAPVEEVSAETAKAAALLQSLNILKGDENGNLNLSGEVTRAEFAAFVVRMMGQESVAEATAGVKVFDDVPGEHWGSGYISVAYNTGIILGYGDGNFGPDALVTGEQAIKMIVCALGYKALAEKRGPWPTGYLLVGDDMDISDGIKIVANTPAKRADIVKMIFNSVEIDVMRATATTEDGEAATSYTVVEGENVLTYYLGLEKAQGVVSANGITRLNSTTKSPVKDGQIQLGYVDVFETGITDAKDYIGHAVNVYCVAENGERTIIHIEKKAKSTETVVSGEDVDVDESSLSELVWYEDQGEDETSFEIADGAHVLLNGRYIGDVGEGVELADITPDNGTITLIDSDGNKEADTIIVRAYRTLVVERVATTSSKVFDYYTGDNVLLNVESKYEDVTIKNKAGEDIALKNINEWDVICLYQSGEEGASGTVKEAIVCTDKVTGTVSRKSSDNNKYTIDGTTYELANIYLDYLDTNSKATPVLGKKYTFLFDIEGKIVGTQNVGSSLAENQKYGYLLNAKVDSARDTIRLYIYTTTGQFQYFPLAKKVKLNGYLKDTGTTDENDLLFYQERKSRNLITLEIDELLGNSKYINSIFTAGAVLYTTNASGEITELRVDTAGTLAYPNYDPRYEGQFVKAVGSSTVMTNYANVLNGKYRITSKTVGLTIPNNLEDTDFFSPALPELSSTANANTYSFDLYDVKEDGEVGLAILRADYAIEINVVSDTIYAFKGVGQAVNKDDEIVTEMNLVTGSTERIKNVADPTYYRCMQGTTLSATAALQTAIENAFRVAEDKNIRVDYKADYQTDPESIYDLRFGDLGMAVVKNNVYAAYLPIFKMTGIDTETGEDVSLEDFHFEYTQHSSTPNTRVSDLEEGMSIEDLVSDEIPLVLDETFQRYYRVTFYGEAVDSSSTSITMFTTTHKDGDQWYRKERLVPASNVTVAIVDMKAKTITPASMKDIVPGDKVLYSYNYDLKGYIYIYRW